MIERLRSTHNRALLARVAELEHELACLTEEHRQLQSDHSAQAERLAKMQERYKEIKFSRIGVELARELVNYIHGYVLPHTNDPTRARYSFEQVEQGTRRVVQELDSLDGR